MNITKKLIITLASSFTMFSTEGLAEAALTNPAIQGPLGNSEAEATSGASFLSYFIFLWQALISVGALTLIFYFVWGGLEWIYAGGDSGKVQKARDKMTQAAIGMIILTGSFVIIALISQVFFGTLGFDILKPTLPNPTGGSGAAIP